MLNRISITSGCHEGLHRVTKIYLRGFALLAQPSRVFRPYEKEDRIALLAYFVMPFSPSRRRGRPGIAAEPRSGIWPISTARNDDQTMRAGGRSRVLNCHNTA